MSTLQETLTEVMTLIAKGNNVDAIQTVSKLLVDLPWEIRLFDHEEQRAIVWSVEDVLSVADRKGLGAEINALVAKDVLDDMIEDHDASIGINFDTIDMKLEDFE